MTIWDTLKTIATIKKACKIYSQIANIQKCSLNLPVFYFQSSSVYET